MSSGNRKRPYDAPVQAVQESSKRQRKEGALCDTTEPHTCPAPPSHQKKKWYGVVGGPNPGVHFAHWEFIQSFGQGHYGVKSKSFGDPESAKRWYQQQMPPVPRRPVQTSEPQRQDQATRSLTPQRTDLNHVQQQQTFDFNPKAADFTPSEQPTLQPTEKAAPLPSSESQHVNTPNPPREPPLSEEQEMLVNLIVEKRMNVFYTGSAGVGKSTVLKAFRRRLAAKGLKVNVVAPTGRAALDINGQTTWSYAGWTPDSMKRPLEALKKDAWKRTVKKRLRQTDVLVIDEISMVENLHLERLNAIMKEVRQSPDAFGGAQVVITGDFCQLPPVKPFQHCFHCGGQLVELARNSAYRCTRCDRTYQDEDKWAFRSAAWKEAKFEHINLQTIHRQNDTTFIEILQKLRLGKPLLPDEHHLLLNHESETDKAVKLFSLRAKVKAENDKEFIKLKETTQAYDCVDNFEQRSHHVILSCYHEKGRNDKTLKKLEDHRFDAQLYIKKGMLIILTANINIGAGLVNGSQGTVIGFADFWGTEAKDFPDERKIQSIADTLEGEYKEYRALEIFKFMQNARHKSWPVVRFLNGIEIPITAECYPTELGDEPPYQPNYSLLSRTQIPLMAGWAITIHKAQGMTLSKVEINLDRSFEEGQAYVALSRARNLKGLKLTAFPESAQKGCNEEVKEFLYEKFRIE